MVGLAWWRKNRSNRASVSIVACSDGAQALAPLRERLVEAAGAAPVATG